MARLRGSGSTRRPATDARAKAWASMRVLRRFDAPALISVCGISRDNATKYLAQIAQAGFLRRLSGYAGGKAGVFAEYQIARDSGPRAPIVRLDCTIYDPNTGKRYGRDGAEVFDAN